MSARDDAAREAALSAYIGETRCAATAECGVCDAYRAGWDGAPRLVAYVQGAYIDGARDRRYHDAATRAAQGGGE